MNLKSKKHLIRNITGICSLAAILTLDTPNTFAETKNDIYDAISANDLDTVKDLIENQHIGINIKGKNSLTPLEFATMYKKLDICEFLIKSGADINVCDEYGDALIIHQARIENPNVHKPLISNDADINKKNKYNNTSLNRKIKTEDTNVCEFLINHGANVNAKDEYGDTLLIREAGISNTDVCEFLINHGAYIETHGKNGDTPLIRAAQTHHKDICELLLNHHADVNALDKNNDTALIKATQTEDQEICKLLIENGANVNSIIDQNGATLLHKAAKEDDLNMCEFLIDYDADINAKDNQLLTPLDYAVTNNSTRVINFLNEYIESLQNDPNTFCSQDGFKNYIKTNKIKKLKCPLCSKTRPAKKFIYIYDHYHGTEDDDSCYEHAICEKCFKALQDNGTLEEYCPICPKPSASSDAEE